MCGRFQIIEADEISERFDADAGTIEPNPNYNVSPSQRVFTVSRNSPNKIIERKWGIVPKWVKDPSKFFKPINARAETVTTNGIFKTAFKSKRCLVPANGWYEWLKEGEGKTALKRPHFFHFKDSRLFAFAGLYETWADAEGVEQETFTIITTEANDLCAEIHPRMPVILDKREEEIWLSESSTPEELVALLDPYPADELEIWEVDKKVGSPKNNDPSVYEPINSDRLSVASR